KAQDLVKQVKEALGDNKKSTIRINEVKFVAADPATGEISVAAQIAAQSLGPEFKQWLNDPQKMLQLIAAAQGASTAGGVPGGAPLGAVPTVPSPGGQGGGTWSGGTVPLQEEEVIQAIRMLTHFGQVMNDPNANPDALKVEISKAPEGAKLN